MKSEIYCKKLLGESGLCDDHVIWMTQNALCRNGDRNKLLSFVASPFNFASSSSEKTITTHPQSKLL